MSYLFGCLLVFLFGFVVNMTFITVFYHRGLAHHAVKVSNWARRLVVATGPWMTGIDAKAWICMHRLHHMHSDTAADPHSPGNVGHVGVLLEQLRSYENIKAALIAGDRHFTSLVPDLDFPVHWLSRKNLWLLPYILHGSLALAFALATGAWLMGAAYWVGMLSHPLQGWLVNALAHSRGYRNYNLSDQSTNNTWVALVTMGEGYQNNHHRYPRAAKFSQRWFEVDFGYGLCLLAEAVGSIKIEREERFVGLPLVSEDIAS